MHTNLNPEPATGRNVAVGYLRAFVTLLGIAHPAALAAFTALGQEPNMQAMP